MANTGKMHTIMMLYAWQYQENKQSVFAPCSYYKNLMGGTKSLLLSDNPQSGCT